MELLNGVKKVESIKKNIFNVGVCKLYGFSANEKTNDLQVVLDANSISSVCQG